MKRFFSFMLMLTIILSVVLCGCKEEKKRDDYAVNVDGIVNIGVLLPLSENSASVGEKIKAGIDFAFELAPGVNINNQSKHLINLIYRDVEGDIDAAYGDFKNNRVAAVICAGITADNTDAVISAFENDNTPILFMDDTSIKQYSSSNALTIGIPYSYQASVAATHFNEEELKVGAVVAPGNDYGKKIAKMFKDAFLSGGGTSVSEYYYGSEDENFNENTIAKSEPDFVFVVGSQEDTKELYSLIKNAGSDAYFMLSEVADKTEFENDGLFNGLVYISKYERDDSNYIGTDFAKTYSKMKDCSVSDVTSATAYGYDAYMMIYGALMSFNSNSASFSSDNTTGDSDATSSDVMVSQVLSVLKKTPHLGVTDSISFKENGSVDVKYLYLSKILNGNASMFDKYNYNNETE